MADNPIIAKALKRFALSEAASTDQRKREKEDLAFQVPEMQWTTEAKKNRRGGDGSDTAGIPVPPRPMYSITMVDQPVQLVQSQIRQARLGVQIHPLTDDADDDTAEVLQDLYRATERDSNAGLVREWAADRALKCGMGWYRLVPEYADEGNDSDQKVVLKRIMNQGSVYPDPYAQEPDFSDGQFLFQVIDLPWARYIREFPDSEMAGYEDTDFEGLGSEQLKWMGGSDEETRTVRVAEYFTIDYAVTTIDLGEGRTRTKSVPKVRWRKINCIEVLEETELPGPYIPYVPVIGRELQVFDQERRWIGIYTNAKDSQRLLNWSVSNMVEKEASAPKGIWLLAEGQEEGHEHEFVLASVRNLPYLRYKPTSLDGKPVKEPSRIVNSVDISADILLIEQSRGFIQANTSTYDASLGKSNAGDPAKKVLALQQQSDAGNSGYLDNLASISMRHEARIWLSWCAHYYDRPGRIVRTVKPDMTEVPVMLNQPFVMDAKTQRPRGATNGGMQDAKTYDLKKGVYGVAVTIGKNFATTRLQAADALGRLIEASPEMMPILGPLWLQSQDFPLHDEAAELLKKMQPPQLREGKDGEPDPQAVQAENAQLKQAIQALTQGMQQAQQIIETKQVEQQGKIAETQVDGQTKVELERVKAQQAIDLANLKYQHELALMRFDYKGKLMLQDDEQRHELGLAGADAQAAEQQAQRVEEQAERQSAREMASGVAGEQREDQRSERSATREDARARESADREDQRSAAEREVAQQQEVSE